MLKFHLILLSIALCYCHASSSPIQERSADPSTRLQEAEVLELTGGNIDEALKRYHSIASDSEAASEVKARAYLRIAGVERGRGNLRAAVGALGKVLELGEEGDPVHLQAKQLLENLRKGDESGVPHDWHRAFVENPEIRSKLLRLITDLASPDKRTLRGAHRTLRAYGTIALPVLRGALKTASGSYRFELARATVECGDWNYLDEILTGT